MNIFDESLNILKSKVQVRKMFQDMHVEDLKNVIKRVEGIYDEKLEESRAKEQEENQKREAVEAVMKQLQEKGLSLDDLHIANFDDKPRKNKGKPRQRYQFQFEAQDGTAINWEGATTGRIPADFNDYLARTGKDRKDCIVAEI